MYRLIHAKLYKSQFPSEIYPAGEPGKKICLKSSPSQILKIKFICPVNFYFIRFIKLIKELSHPNQNFLSPEQSSSPNYNPSEPPVRPPRHWDRGLMCWKCKSAVNTFSMICVLVAFTFRKSGWKIRYPDSSMIRHLNLKWSKNEIELS